MWTYLALVYYVLSLTASSKRRREECAYIAARSWRNAEALCQDVVVKGVVLYATGGLLAAVWRVLP